MENENPPGRELYAPNDPLSSADADFQLLPQLEARFETNSGTAQQREDRREMTTAEDIGRFRPFLSYTPGAINSLELHPSH